MGYHLGIIAFQGHCSTVSLFQNNILLGAISEERCSRIKEDSSLPILSLNLLLTQFKISPREIEHVSFAWEPRQSIISHLKNFQINPRYLFEKRADNKDSRVSKFFKMINLKKMMKIHFGIDAPITYYRHHACHALVSINHSKFESGLCLVIDGVGDNATITLYKFDKLTLVEKETISFPHSLGLFFSSITELLGFRPDLDEYKVMGLAAFGKDIYKQRLSTLISIDGINFKLNMEYYLHNQSGSKFISSKLINLFQDINLAEFQNMANIAASAQALLEESVIKLIKEIDKKYNPQQDLCFSGGVFQNCKLNQKLREYFKDRKLFFSPLSSDLGTAVGAGIAHSVQMGWGKVAINSLSLGCEYNKEEILNILAKYNLIFREVDKPIQKIATLLADDKIIAIFRGRAELGPRALGFRSIISSPVKVEMRDKINKIIKNRESFRPFAPVIASDFADTYFQFPEDKTNFQFMIETVQAKEITFKKAPAIVHVDGTSRVQVVEEYLDHFLYNLILEFEKKTGVPILLNTSFNSKDEPIVNSPFDAINFFLNSEIDFLVIENFLIEKKVKSL